MIIVAPSSHADSPSAFLAATSIESSSLEGVRVLAVDDDDDARELLRTILESRAATVLVAANAREAFELLARESIRTSSYRTSRCRTKTATR